jgi:kinesin family protein 2/24
MAIPFKERIRPGMVVSWNESPNHLSLSTVDNIKLAVILCPVDAAKGTTKGTLENVANERSIGHADTAGSRTNHDAQYLCALVTPGLMAEAYELNLWRQIVVNVDSMDKEVILEYDAGTRYYYIAV